MTPWKQNFESQQCLELVRGSLNLLSSASTEKLSEDGIGQFTRLLKILKVLEHRFLSLDPELFPQNTWGNFNSWLNDCRNNIEQFTQNQDPGHIVNANTWLDHVVAVFRPLDLISGSDGAKPIADAAEAFQRASHAEVEKLRSKCDELAKAVERLTEALNQSKSRLEENNQTIEQQKGRLDQSIAEFQRQFSQAESSRSAEFSAASVRFGQEFGQHTGSFQSHFDEAVKQRNAHYEDFLTKEKGSSDAHRDFLKKREGEVNEIFGSIGSASLSGHFKKTADDDQTAANRFRIVALVAMGVMVVLGVLTFYQSLQHPEINWQIFAFRLGTTLVIALPAIYAAQESAKHRERERSNRKLQLELASIDAYLALLPEAKQFELKEKLTEKFFGKADEAKVDEAISKHALFELLSSVLKNLTKPK